MDYVISKNGNMQSRNTLLYPRIVTLSMHMALYMVEHKLDINAIKHVCHSILPMALQLTVEPWPPNCYCTCVINWNEENIHSKLMVHCWRQNTVSVFTTYKPSLCTLHPNKSTTLLWYNVLYQYQHIIFYKVLNTGINPSRWPSTIDIWNMWEKLQYIIYTL